MSTAMAGFYMSGVAAVTLFALVVGNVVRPVVMS